MNLLFWEKKPATAESGGATEQAASTGEAEPRPGWLARLKSALLPLRRKPGRADAEGSPVEGTGNGSHEEPAPSAAKAATWRPLALSPLLVLAAGAGYMAAKSQLPGEQRHAPAASLPIKDASTPAPAAADLQARIEVLKSQNREMQAQIEALKKQGASPPVVPAGHPQRGASAPPKDGVLIISGQNIKESAQGLKEVIAQMNAASATESAPRK